MTLHIRTVHHFELFLFRLLSEINNRNMDCRITDSKNVLRADSIVSVPPDHFEEEAQTERYFGAVLRLTQDERARARWFVTAVYQLNASVA